MKRALLVLGLVLGVAMTAHAMSEHGPMPASSAEMSRLKNLVGSWDGTSVTGGEEKPVHVDYRLTSGGSALVETLFAGTPDEMVSVYYDANGQVAMTHYCMLGNQPRVALAHADAQTIALSLAPDSGLDVATPHMHALTLAWTDPDRLTQTWTFFEGGQAEHSTVITLSRVR